MARRILVVAPWFAAALIFCLTPSAKPAVGETSSPECISHDLANAPISIQNETRELREHVSAGPVFNEMIHRLGKPQSCDVKLDGETISLLYSFRHNAQLQARQNTSIEYSELRAQFRGLGNQQARSLLKKEEKNSFGSDGCGLNWNKPEDEATGDQPGRHSVIYRGSSCNCQARLIYQAESVVELILSSAC